MIDFPFRYRITYKTGQVYDSDRSSVIAQVSRENCKKIVKGALEGKPINKIGGISEVLDQLIENVNFSDRFKNMNGTYRSKPLKKPREIISYEFFLTDYDYNRFKKMKDPSAIFEYPAQKMTVYHDDGTEVTIIYENGKVSINDGSSKYGGIVLDQEYFIQKITR